jgi:hypothetical protein
MKTLKERLEKNDQEAINLLIRYNIIKKQEDEYVPVPTPYKELTLEEYEELDKKLKGIISKDDGDSVVYIPWEEKKEGTVIITRRLKGFKHSV